MRKFVFIILIFFPLDNSFSYPQIVEVKGNKDYLLIEENTLPIIDVRISFDMGSIHDKNKKGITSFAVNLLHQQLYQNKKIIYYFEKIGAQYNSNVTKEKTEFMVRFVSSEENIKYISKMLNIMLKAEYLSDEMVQDNIERVIGIIDRRNLDPSSLVQKKANEIFYSNTTYSHPSIGYKEYVKSFNVGDAREKINEIITSNTMSISIVGNISENMSAFMISNIIGEIDGPGQIFESSSSTPKNNNKSVHIPFDSTQTHILIYIPAITRSDSDFYNLLVANHIFGGSGFGSMLMTEIREKRGLAYSVYSYMLPYEDFGVLKIYMQTKNENVNEALSIIEQQIMQLKNFDIPNEKVEKTKTSIKNNLISRLDTNKNMLNTLSAINDYNLEKDYFKNYIYGIDNVNLSSIKSALENKLDFDNSMVFTLGNK